MLHKIIMACERGTVNAAIKSNCMPTPTGEVWEAIQKEYNLPTPEPVDRVVSRVTLPPGWSVAVDPNDFYGRNTIITDDTGERVGEYFLKNTGYDYYGHISFNVERLIKLGIVKKFQDILMV